MCELFGVSSKVKKDWSVMLTEFFTHGKDNPHGWGLAEIDEEETKVIRDTVQADMSIKNRKRLADPVDARTVIAHVRFATKGDVTLDNTHPFTAEDESGATWTLAHNGTVFESSVLAGYFHKQKGTSDSERILLYLIDRINAGLREVNNTGSQDSDEDRKQLPFSDRIQIVDDVIKEITPENKVNLLLSDGSLLYVHINCDRGMYYLDEGDSTVFSTKPLSAAAGNEYGRTAGAVWEEVPLNTLLVYMNGRMIYRGCPHDNTFVETEEKMRYLFMDYSEM